jgi:lipoprotein-anchoring transpeptidase ErfK/SrfK
MMWLAKAVRGMVTQSHLAVDVTAPGTPSGDRSPGAVMRLGRLRHCLVTGLLAACLAVVIAGFPVSAVAGGQARQQATQELVVLLKTHGAHQAPAAGSPQVALVASRRPITGEQTTLPVLARSIAAGGVRWLQVMLPGRPNGSTGWITQTATRPLVTPWRIAINLAQRRVSVYRNGRVVRGFRAVIGKTSTPTPTGQFFVEEVVQMRSGEPGGPFALALSARSNVLQEFEGGPGQIGVHGRENLGGTLGTAASHGCVRLSTLSIDWLAAHISSGTPTTIYAG